jgi:shikimate dehydrogenase
MRSFFLLGKSLPHSYSPAYFTEKFRRERIVDATYSVAELPEIGTFPEWISQQNSLAGMNVTIPYKSVIIPFLDAIDDEAKAIGAVNTIAVRTRTGVTSKMHPNLFLQGYNTDAPAFSAEIRPLLRPWMDTALILGNGGSAATVRYVLQKIGLNCITLSRNRIDNILHWNDLNPSLVKHTKLIVNTTPLGQFPAINDYPPIPFEALSPEHLVFDLIYNPEQTRLLQLAQERGCMVQNGLGMLHLQAEKSWEIWNATD